MVATVLLVDGAHHLYLITRVLGQLFALEEIEKVLDFGLFHLHLKVTCELALYIHLYHLEHSHYLSYVGAVASRVVQKLLIV